jgi:hypothetical protein
MENEGEEETGKNVGWRGVGKEAIKIIKIVSIIS